jgi:hypothetical protein
MDPNGVGKENTKASALTSSLISTTLFYFIF